MHGKKNLFRLANEYININNELTQKIKNYIVCLNDVILYSILDLQLKSYVISQNNISFRYIYYNDLSPDKLIKYNQYVKVKDMYSYCINFERLFKGISLAFVSSRLVLFKSLMVITKKSLKQGLISNIVREIDNYSLNLDSGRYRYQSGLAIFSILHYSLVSEGFYLIKHLISDQTINIDCLSVGSEILLSSSNTLQLKHFVSIIDFLSVAGNSKNKAYLYQSINYKSAIYTFCGYSIFHKNYRKVVIGISKIAQQNLLRQVNNIFEGMLVNRYSDLISYLNLILQQWFTKFYLTRDYKNFIILDYILSIKISNWIRKNKIKIKISSSQLALFKLRRYKF